MKYEGFIEKEKHLGCLIPILSVWVQGGGWCNSISSCSLRKMTALGSSKYMDRQVPFSGILSSDPAQNPGKASASSLATLLLPNQIGLGFFIFLRESAPFKFKLKFISFIFCLVLFGTE